MSEIFFARYYRFFRYSRTISEESCKSEDLSEGFNIKELDPDKDYEKFKEAWGKIYSGILPEPYVEFDKKILLKYPKTFILEDKDNNILGFIVCYIKPVEKKGKILRIGVLNKERKKGLGENLYRKACQYYLSNNIKEIYFDVYESDQGLQKLATKMGFEKTDEFFITIDDPVEQFLTLETIMSL